MSDPSQAILDVINNYWEARAQGKSRSEADFATVVWLLRRKVSETSILRLFELSGCMLSLKYMDKERVGGARAYLNMTMKKARQIAEVSERVGEIDLSQYRLDQMAYLDLPFLPVPLLSKLGVPGLVGLTTITGPPSVYKSFFGLHAAREGIQMGRRVMILDFENGAWRTRSRLRVIYPGYESSDESVKARLIYWDGRDFSADKLQVLVQRTAPDLLIVDPIQKLSRDSKNYFSDLRQWLGILEDLKKDSGTVILGLSQIKREKYDVPSGLGSGFGSSAIEYNADLVLSLSRKDETVICRIEKYRDGAIASYMTRWYFGKEGLQTREEENVIKRPIITIGGTSGNDGTTYSPQSVTVPTQYTGGGTIIPTPGEIPPNEGTGNNPGPTAT